MITVHVSTHNMWFSWSQSVSLWSQHWVSGYDVVTTGLGRSGGPRPAGGAVAQRCFTEDLLIHAYNYTYFIIYINYGILY